MSVPSALYQRQIELGSPPANAGKIHVQIYVDGLVALDGIVDKETAEVLQSLTPRKGVNSSADIYWPVGGGPGSGT